MNPTDFDKEALVNPSLKNKLQFAYEGLEDRANTSIRDNESIVQDAEKMLAEIQEISATSTVDVEKTSKLVKDLEDQISQARTRIAGYREIIKNIHKNITRIGHI